MAIAASGQGGLLVRADQATSHDLLTSTGVRPMEMRGRQMQGWLRVDTEAVRTKRQLEKWVRLGAGYAPDASCETAARSVMSASV